jgi:PPP family 3-phenylpropionic acid transporter
MGILFATGTAVRLVSGPVAGRLADLTQARRAVLAVCTTLSGLVALGLVAARGFWPLLLVSLGQAAALAPITTLADALALGAAAPAAGQKGFEYGWVRGTGSGIFIVGTLISGQVVGAFGLTSIVVLHAALLLGAVGAALLIPERLRQDGPGDHQRRPGVPRRPAEGLLELLAIARFRYVMLVSALVLGSHAMHDAFAVIRWSAAGISPAVASVLWSESVAAEVIVFFLIGPALVDRLGPGGMAALAAAAGVLRWVVAAFTTDATMLALVQPLHGLTFAGLHLACMRLMAVSVPGHLAATAQAMYAFSAGASSALLTGISGILYARLGAHGFLVMAVFSAAAIPPTLKLRSDKNRAEGGALPPPI